MPHQPNSPLKNVKAISTINLFNNQIAYTPAYTPVSPNFPFPQLIHLITHFPFPLKSHFPISLNKRTTSTYKRTRKKIKHRKYETPNVNIPSYVKTQESTRKNTVFQRENCHPKKFLEKFLGPFFWRSLFSGMRLYTIKIF